MQLLFKFEVVNGWRSASKRLCHHHYQEELVLLLNLLFEVSVLEQPLLHLFTLAPFMLLLQAAVPTSLITSSSVQRSDWSWFSVKPFRPFQRLGSVYFDTRMSGVSKFFCVFFPLAFAVFSELNCPFDCTNN